MLVSELIAELVKQPQAKKVILTDDCVYADVLGVRFDEDEDAVELYDWDSE